MLMANLLVSCIFHCMPVAADMISTEIVLKNEYMRETNIQDRGKRLAVNAGIAAGTTWLDHKMAKKPVLRWTFRIAHLALGAYAVHHNWKELEKAQNQRNLARQYGGK